MAWAGLGLLMTVSIALILNYDWKIASSESLMLIIIAYLFLALTVHVFLRYQLRIRRWAAYRVAGCDWLLAEWLPGSPRALLQEKLPPSIALHNVVLDWIFPIPNSVSAVNSNLNIYTQEIAEAYLKLQNRSTNAIKLEWIIHVIYWIFVLSVIIKIWIH